MRFCAVSSSRFGSLLLFFIAVIRITTSWLGMLQNMARAIPSGPLARISNSPRPSGAVCGLPRSGPNSSRRPRYHLHYTPTYASWLNQVERWFGIITQRAIRRGTFSSVKQLTGKIDRFVNDYNTKTRPFVWTATADSILAKVERLSKVICGTAH